MAVMAKDKNIIPMTFGKVLYAPFKINCSQAHLSVLHQCNSRFVRIANQTGSQCQQKLTQCMVTFEYTLTFLRKKKKLVDCGVSIAGWNLLKYVHF